MFYSYSGYKIFAQEMREELTMILSNEGNKTKSEGLFVSEKV